MYGYLFELILPFLTFGHKRVRVLPWLYLLWNERIFFCSRSTKAATPNNALNVTVAFLHKYSETGLALP